MVSTRFTLNELKRIYKAFTYARKTLNLGKQVGKIFVFVSPFEGSFSPPGTKMIFLSHDQLNQSKKQNAIQTILHELIHVFDYRGSGGDPFLYKSQTFIEASNNPETQVGMLGALGDPSYINGDQQLLYEILNNSGWHNYQLPDNPTDYSKTSSMEDFAESSTIYIMNKNGFSIPLDPIRKAIIESLVNIASP